MSATPYLLTVTPNPAVDRVIFIEEFRPNGVMRAQEWVDSVGGKALDASVALQTLGAPNLALAFLAGETGRRLARLLEGYDIPCDAVWTGGETRTAHVIVETAHRRHSHVMTGNLEIEPQHAADFLALYRQRLPGASWALTGGSLPPGLPPDFYALLAEEAAATHVPLLVDAAGSSVTQMLRRCRPAILKMNRDEFGQTFTDCAADMRELVQCASGLRSQLGLAALVLTCGAQGILALSDKGGWLAAAPPQRSLNAAGAGDAVSGALAYRLALGDPWPEALRYAAAVGAAVVLTPGTADFRPADLQRILPATVFEPVA